MAGPPVRAASGTCRLQDGSIDQGPAAGDAGVPRLFCGKVLTEQAMSLATLSEERL